MFIRALVPNLNGTTFASLLPNTATMDTNNKKKLIQPRSWIDLDDKDEMQFWCGKFGVSAEEIRRAVKKNGSVVENLENIFSK